jgi:hypothetical protein
MSQFVSLPPVSPGIAYAVRTLLERAPESEAAARSLCGRLWPKMDAEVVQVVVTYWGASAAAEPAKLTAITGSGRRPS